MFNQTSRYANIEDATLIAKDGRVILYKKRRFLPRRDSTAKLEEVTVNPGERLDHIAAKSLGDPEQFWRICDVNSAIYPPELTDREIEPDREKRVFVPVG